MADKMKLVIEKVADGLSLDGDEAEAAFDVIMSGEATPSQIGAFLMALRLRGETVEEIAAAARVMRAKMVRVDAPAGAIDIVGTGGDGKGTLNVSTAAAFLVAGAGAPVAKHGNRKLSSLSGAGDVLQAYGVNVDVGPETVSRAIREAGVGFMMAPKHHAAVRHVMPTRQELGVRTVFNILGPLTNPAGVELQMTGVFAERWLRPMAETLRALGARRAWLVHGGDGSDELSISGPSRVVSLDAGEIAEFDVSPADAGLPEHPFEAILGGAPEVNAAAFRALLDGAQGSEQARAYRDVVLLNAAAALVVAGRAADLREGAAHARESLETGRARAAAEALVRITNEPSA